MKLGQNFRWSELHSVIDVFSDEQSQISCLVIFTSIILKSICKYWKKNFFIDDLYCHKYVMHD